MRQGKWTRRKEKSKHEVARRNGNDVMHHSQNLTCFPSHRVFDVSNGNACVGVCRDFTRAVFSTDWSPTEDKLAVAGGDASIKFINVVEKREMDEAISDENLRSDVGNLNINK